jgi:hypothetical protein
MKAAMDKTIISPGELINQQKNKLLIINHLSLGRCFPAQGTAQATPADATSFFSLCT